MASFHAPIHCILNSAARPLLSKIRTFLCLKSSNGFPYHLEEKPKSLPDHYLPFISLTHHFPLLHSVQTVGPPCCWERKEGRREGRKGGKHLLLQGQSLKTLHLIFCLQEYLSPSQVFTQMSLLQWGLPSPSSLQFQFLTTFSLFFFLHSTYHYLEYYTFSFIYGVFYWCPHVRMLVPRGWDFCFVHRCIHSDPKSVWHIKALKKYLMNE